jgi:mannosyltransferase
MVTDSPSLVTRGSLHPRTGVQAEPSWWPIVTLTFVGGILRFWRLGHQSLWLDETLTFLDARVSLPHILAGAVDPKIPPLYYLIVHCILPWGSGEALLRLPSAILGTLTIPVFYQVVRRWCGYGVAVVAAGLLTFSPFHIWYSQEARPYILLLFLAVAAVYFLQAHIERPRSMVLAAGFLLSAAGTFYAHPVALPFFGIICGYVLLMRQQRMDWGRWIREAMVLALLLSPAVIWLAVLPPGVSANRYFHFQPTHLGYVLWTFGAGYSLGPTLSQLGLEGFAAVIRNIAVVGPAIILLLAMLTVGAVHLWRSQRKLFWTLLLFLMLPIGFAALAAILTEQAFNARYAIVAFPAYVALLAIGVGSIPRFPWRIGVSAGLGLISLASLTNYYDNPQYQREDTRAAVSFINAAAEPGELVVGSASYMVIPIRHYGLRPDLTLVAYPPVGSTLHEQVGVRLVTPARVAADLDSLVGARPRVWLFLSRTFHSDPSGEIQYYFDTRLVRQAEQSWAGVRVLLYTRRDEASPNR